MNICKESPKQKQPVQLIPGHIYSHAGIDDLYLYALNNLFVSVQCGGVWPDTQTRSVQQLTDVTDKYCLSKV